MELRQLKYFLKLAETLNFSSAAKELFITQSTLSQQILNLEREFDQPLFVRNSHEVQLTEAGRLLMPHAQESINAAENCITLVQELKHMLVGELNVGVTFSFSNIMAETMAEFLKKYPNVKLNVCYDSMAVLMEKLQHHDLDLVLAFKPLKTDNRIDSEVLFHTRASAIVNEFHPLARQSKVTLEELQKYGLGEDFLALEQSVESYMSAMKKSGLTPTAFSEQRLGFQVNGPKGQFKIGVTPDQLYSWGVGGQ